MTDARYREAVAGTAERYLDRGPCLIHGDYFPGSWLRTVDGVRVIDPEFSFPGDPEVDLGCAVAHMALAGQPLEVADRFLAAYTSESAEVDPGWLARYAAVEVMRRLIGVAQLPLAVSKTEGSRCGLLEKSRQTMTGGPIDDLF
jgi:5-methylthioribose kinase